MAGLRSLATVPFAPGHLPVLGHIPEFRKRPLEFLGGLRRAGDVVRVGLGPRKFVYFNDPDAVHDIMVRKGSSFGSGAFLNRIGPLIHEGALLVMPYERHLAYRKELNSHFRHSRVHELSAAAVENTRALVEEWEQEKPFRLDLALLRLSAANSCSALLGRRLANETEQAVARSAMTIGQLQTARAILPAWIGRLPLPANRRFVEACELLRSVVRECSEDETSTERSLLDSLAGAVAAEGNGHAASERIVGDGATLLFGGIETVSSVMAWFFWELSRHPEVARRVWEEVDHLAGGGGIAGDDREAFRWLEAALWETLRLHPGVVLIRRVQHEVTVGDVELPVGTEILMSPYVMHRDPRFFSRPERFDPQRWLDRTESPGHAYIPFGAGHRKCLGDNQAMAQMVLSLALIGARWRVQVTNATTVREVVAATTRPDRLDAVVFPR